jgi:hypothetical protein
MDDTSTETTPTKQRWLDALQHLKDIAAKKDFSEEGEQEFAQADREADEAFRVYWAESSAA